MSLFQEPMRPPPIASDAAFRRYLESIRPQIEPDPLFLRRLRGTVVNEFVAAREGMVRSVAGRSAMGRLGRACLYASVALAMGVGGTMAASQSAVPGDPLYGVKIRIEELRLEALPAAFHDQLIAYSLSERISELAQLAAAGDLERAEALAGPIAEEVAALEAIGVDPGQAGMIAANVEALGAVLERLPEKAQAAVQKAMASAPGLLHEPGTPAVGHGQGTNNGGTNNGEMNQGNGTNNGGSNQGKGTNNGGTNNGGTNNGGTNNGGGTTGSAAGASVAPTPTPSPDPSPESTTSPTKSPKPSEKPKSAPGQPSPPANSEAEGSSD